MRADAAVGCFRTRLPLARCRSSHAPVPLFVIVTLFLGVTALRWFLENSGEAVALLYLVPIVLAALGRGRRGGVISASAAAASFALLTGLRGRGDLDVTGWALPILAMYLLGVVVGQLVERLAARTQLAAHAVDRRRELEQLCVRQQAALRVSDSMLQGVAAARWMLEAGRTEQAIDTLGATVAEGVQHLSAALASGPTRDRSRAGVPHGPSALRQLDNALQRPATP